MRAMSDKAPPAGWVVQVTTPGQPSSWLSSPNASRYNAGLLGAPSFKYFNAAIAVAGKAIEAAKHFAEAEGREAHVVRSLSSKEIAALGLMPGEVKPA